jgi:hypothetical protein
MSRYRAGVRLSIFWVGVITEGGWPTLSVNQKEQVLLDFLFLVLLVFRMEWEV